MKGPQVVFIFAALLFLPVSARAGKISGRVYLSDELAMEVLVSVEGVREIPAHSRVTAYLDHTGQKFLPHVLPIVVGTRVEFRSTERMPCRLFSISEAGAFNLMRQTGPVKSLRFHRPGVIQVRCRDHPSTYAYILVKENPYFALTDALGEYTISGISEGQRVVQAWFEGRVLEQETVEIGKRETFLDFRVDRPQRVSLLLPEFSN
ncbi:hypothetical protein MYX78_02550 [Acidobacteria bacterium AH-259-G07]|nr:hypothetical protein [Acidobacteria bacterium AH-259-G07]